MTASKSNNKLRMEEWKVTSDTSEGFHECIIPENRIARLYIYIG